MASPASRQGDYRGVAAALAQMGATSDGVDVEAFGRDLEDVVRRISSLSTNVLIEASGKTAR